MTGQMAGAAFSNRNEDRAKHWLALSAGIAVAAFLAEQIPFTGIPSLIAQVMEKHQPQPVISLDAVLDADQWARETARSLINTQQSVEMPG